jgi:hypothetical protein
LDETTRRKITALLKQRRMHFSPAPNSNDRVLTRTRRELQSRPAAKAWCLLNNTQKSRAAHFWYWILRRLLRRIPWACWSAIFKLFMMDFCAVSLVYQNTAVIKGCLQRNAIISCEIIPQNPMVLPSVAFECASSSTSWTYRRLAVCALEDIHDR